MGLVLNIASHNEMRRSSIQNNSYGKQIQSYVTRSWCCSVRLQATTIAPSFSVCSYHMRFPFQFSSPQQSPLKAYSLFYEAILLFLQDIIVSYSKAVGGLLLSSLFLFHSCSKCKMGSPSSVYSQTLIQTPNPMALISVDRGGGWK